jgi:2-polyprenyl-6-methoxyphenol hydroxylase-like FAD-dependent oxidoreductase
MMSSQHQALSSNIDTPTTTMPPLKVLIIGGGLAGPSLAFWLNHLNHTVTIVERHPDLRANGQQIDLRGQGLKVMRYMGLEAPIRSKIVDEEGFQFVDSAGNQQAVLGANKSGKGRQSLSSEWEIMRGDLVRILYQVTKDKTRYIFGTTVDGLEEVDGGVRVTFKDGKEEVFDLVVGADGLHSKTRRMMLGPDAPEPFWSLRNYFAYFTAPRIASDSKYATAYQALGSRIVITRPDNPKTTQVYLSLLTSAKGADIIGPVMRDRKAGVVAQKKAWAEAFRDAGWQTERLLDAMMNDPHADDFYAHEVGQIRLDTWSKGRVTLLGDAGYCPTPFTGFGTSMALVGAYVLAGELATHTGTDGKVDVLAALEGYEKTLRPLVDEVQKIHPWRTSIAYSETWWGIKIFQTLVWLFTSLRLDKLMQMLMSDDRGTWKLPNYQGLRTVS